jgi:hypothetical protein
LTEIEHGVLALLVASVIALVAQVAFAIASRRSRGEAFRPEAWAALSERWPGLRLHPDGPSPALRGEVDGVAVTVVAHTVAGRATTRKGSRATTAPRAVRSTEITTVVRARVPAGIVVVRRPKPWSARTLFSGATRVEAEDPVFDRALRVTADDADAAVALLERPEVRSALLGLVRAGPTATLNERMVRVRARGQRSGPDLEAALDAVLALVRALEDACPPLPARPARAARAAPAAPRTRSLSPVLRSVTLQRGVAQQLALGQLKIEPFAVEIEIDRVEPAPEGSGRVVIGELARAGVRIHATFDPEWDPLADHLNASDVITAEVLVDDFDPTRRVVHATAQTPPAPRATPEPHA